MEEELQAHRVSGEGFTEQKCDGTRTKIAESLTTVQESKVQQQQQQKRE